MEKLFSGEVFIVGGGESLKYFDFSRLRNKDVVACNVAYKWVPWCKLITFWDRQFYDKYRDELIAHPAYKATIDGITDDKDSKILSYDPNINGNVNDTGHFSIRIALELGATIIYLLGFDADGGHFHQEYPYEWTSRGNFFESKFGCYSQELIYNCNQKSKIKTFDIININDIL